MAAIVEKERLTKGFKEFMKVYQKVAVVKSMLEARMLKQQEQLTETQQMLQALEQKAGQMLQAAPAPIKELQEQEE